MVGPMSEVQNASEANQHSSTPESQDSPSPALVPSASAEGVDHQLPTITNDAPSTDSAAPIGPISASTKTLEDLLASESKLAATIAALDPLSPAFIQSLQALATLRYHITAARADIAAAHNPKYLKELTKATAIVQRDHLRLAREHSANERERLRREREERAAQRAKERQEHQERLARDKIRLEELKLLREQEKTYNNIHKESHKNLQLESNAIAARNAAMNTSPSHSDVNRVDAHVGQASCA